eukprot:TRINITY_DN37349_c0_g1_i1.p1 TRINITY_DN37349_c0_g1~~TRINITY_DN37349_c0_g1_i1.p1  ORF type:complete len:138 (-),score=44.77 TRINITY_DN37349_c0_g1_i1:157-570(-)
MDQNNMGGFENNGGCGAAGCNAGFDDASGVKGGKGKGKKGGGKGKKGGGFKGGYSGKGRGKGKGGGKADLYFGGDDSGERLRPKATENECKEARAIVVKAQIDAAERQAEKNAMRAKIGAASADDLQAMINARLKLK